MKPAECLKEAKRLRAQDLELFEVDPFVMHQLAAMASTWPANPICAAAFDAMIARAERGLGIIVANEMTK